jgi:O-antigen/teichoic acid export membrane protein
MTVADFDLFSWWAASISGGSIFLTLVSIYLYSDSKTKRKKSGRTKTRITSVATDFIFVWVLLGLLIFYIVSIDIGSAAIFAAGNILVEGMLVVYLLKNRERKSKQT